MITVKTFEVNMIHENCYVVSDESQECVIVDCGAYFPEDSAKIFQYIEDSGLKPVAHVLTHAHIDHCFGAQALYDKYGLKPIVPARDHELYLNAETQCQGFFGFGLGHEMPPVGRLVHEGDTVNFGRSSLRVIETPGHTQGCVFYYSEENGVAFSGDTLFRGSIGRTDLPGGSMFQIIQSLRMITQYPDTTKVYPGHGPETTIGYECETNMYLDR